MYSPGGAGADLHADTRELTAVELLDHGLLADPQGLCSRFQAQPTLRGIARLEALAIGFGQVDAPGRPWRDL
jgi:hypothetical protein